MSARARERYLDLRARVMNIPDGELMDALLEEMDHLWWQMTDEEQANLPPVAP